MGKVIAIANQKGGCSKTTVTTNLLENYTRGLMTTVFLRVIVVDGIIRTTGPERKGNAADTYDQLHEFISPV